MKLAWLVGMAAMALPAVAEAHGRVGFLFGIGVGPSYCYPSYGGYYGYCGPRYYAPPAVVYAPPPVYYSQPAPVYAPAPVYSYAPPAVEYAPPPVVYDAPPVVYGPSIGLSFGFFGGGGHYHYGHGGYGYHHHRRCMNASQRKCIRGGAEYRSAPA